MDYCYLLLLTLQCLRTLVKSTEPMSGLDYRGMLHAGNREDANSEVAVLVAFFVVRDCKQSNDRRRMTLMV